MSHKHPPTIARLLPPNAGRSHQWRDRRQNVIGGLCRDLPERCGHGRTADARMARRQRRGT